MGYHSIARLLPPVLINNPGWREALRELCLAHEHNNITRHYISGHCNPPPPLPASCLGSVIFLLWPSPPLSLEVDLQSIFYSPLYTLLATTDFPPPRRYPLKTMWCPQIPPLPPQAINNDWCPPCWCLNWTSLLFLYICFIVRLRTKAFLRDKLIF